jgi:hypothetical protein
MKKRLLLYLFFLISSASRLLAQSDSAVSGIPMQKTTAVSLEGHYGSIFAHSADVLNTAGARPLGLHLNVGRQQYGEGAWAKYGCLPRTGLTLAYYDFDNEVLGRGLTAAYYFEPTFPISQRLTLAVRGTLGLAWLSNPYHSGQNPTNLSYSTPLSAYLALGVSTYLRLNPKWSVVLSGNYQHVSNGGLRQPNKGINWPTAGIGVDHTLRPVPLGRPGRRVRSQEWRSAIPRKDFYVFGGIQNVAAGESAQFPIIGAGATYSRQIGRINSLTAGVEAHMDYALREQLARDSLTHLSAVRAGVLLGHEFLLGKVLFSQQMGFYAFQQTPYFPRLYQRWGLLYRFGRSFSAGINLKAHGHIANFWDVRLVKHW